MTLAGKSNGRNFAITWLSQQTVKIIPICFIIFILRPPTLLMKSTGLVTFISNFVVFSIYDKIHHRKGIVNDVCQESSTC